MFPGINQKQVQAMMKQMGISQEEIDASRVIIEKTDNKKIVIKNPSVQKIKMHGQETFQISGEISEEANNKELEIDEEDIKTVIEKTGVPKKVAIETLKKNNGDLAETIIELTK